MANQFFYGWWIVITCFILSFYVNGIVHLSFTAFFDPLINEFGWSYTQIAFAMSLRGLEMSVFAPIIGFLVDRFGSRKLILCGTITAGFGLLLLSVTQSLLMFYGAFLLLSFGAGGCAGVVFMTATAKWFDKNIGKALGVVACGVGAGGLIIPLVVHLIDLYQWRTTLVILGFGMWTLGIPLSFVIRDDPEQYGYLPDGESPHHPKVPQNGKNKAVKIPLREALRQRTFLYLAILEVIRHMIVSSVIIHVMPYLGSVGIPRSTAGMFAAAIPLFSIVGRFGFGWLGDARDKRYMMVVALILMGAGLLAFCYVQHRYMIFIFLLLFSIGCWGSMILSRTIQVEYFGRESFGKMLGILMGFASLGGIIGPTLAGWAFDTLKSYQVVWFGYCGFTGLSIWLTLRMKTLTKVDESGPNTMSVELSGSSMIEPSKVD